MQLGPYIWYITIIGVTESTSWGRRKALVNSATQNTCGGWSQNHFHCDNSQPTEQHSLQDIDISIYHSCIKRKLHENKYRGFAARCKPLFSFKNRKDWLDFAKKTNSWHRSGNSLWTDETKINNYQNNGKKKLRRATASKAYRIICKTWWGQCDGLAVHGCKWHCHCQLSVDDVTHDRSSRINLMCSETYCLLKSS